MKRIRKTLASWLERIARRLRGGVPMAPQQDNGQKEIRRGGGGPIEPL
jgi:hypothetical protein